MSSLAAATLRPLRIGMVGGGTVGGGVCKFSKSDGQYADGHVGYVVQQPQLPMDLDLLVRPSPITYVARLEPMSTQLTHSIQPLSSSSSPSFQMISSWAASGVLRSTPLVRWLRRQPEGV